MGGEGGLISCGRETRDARREARDEGGCQVSAGHVVTREAAARDAALRVGSRQSRRAHPAIYPRTPQGQRVTPVSESRDCRTLGPSPF